MSLARSLPGAPARSACTAAAGWGAAQACVCEALQATTLKKSQSPPLLPSSAAAMARTSRSLSLSLFLLPSFFSFFLSLFALNLSALVFSSLSPLSAPLPCGVQRKSERASKRVKLPFNRQRRFTTMSVCSHAGTTICRKKAQGYATQEKHVWYADKMQMHHQGICLCCFLTQ